MEMNFNLVDYGEDDRKRFAQFCKRSLTSGFNGVLYVLVELSKMWKSEFPKEGFVVML